MCVFIELHITTHSSPVILVILFHSYRSSLGGINDTVCLCVCVCVYVYVLGGGGGGERFRIDLEANENRTYRVHSSSSSFRVFRSWLSTSITSRTVSTHLHLGHALSVQRVEMARLPRDGAKYLWHS